jgi:hypothetical protein
LQQSLVAFNSCAVLVVLCFLCAAYDQCCCLALCQCSFNVVGLTFLVLKDSNLACCAAPWFVEGRRNTRDLKLSVRIAKGWNVCCTHITWTCCCCNEASVCSRLR